MERKEVNLEDIKAVKCDSREQETTVVMERGSNLVKIFSSDNTMITKIKRTISRDKKGSWKCYEGSRNGDGYLTGYFFECPKKCISFRSGDKKKCAPNPNAFGRGKQNA